MCLSRLRSATNCFRFRFSSSNCFKRRNSPTPIPLYFRFQLYSVCSLIPISRHTSSPACFQTLQGIDNLLFIVSLFHLGSPPFSENSDHQKTQISPVQFLGRTSREGTPGRWLSFEQAKSSPQKGARKAF